MSEFNRQSGVRLAAPSDLLRGVRTSDVNGLLDLDTAIDHLLAGTGLEAKRTGPAQFTLVAKGPAQTDSPASAATSADTIVVTARAGVQARTRAETSYSISVIPQEKLREREISSVADSLRDVPGFWVENSGGEASANVRARGIPVDGFGSIQLEEDGLPIQHDPALGYLNADQSFRLDETLSEVQVVRGGPSSVFAPNAPGGLVNYITRKPGSVFQGVAKLTLGDDDLYRGDVWVGGPAGGGWRLGFGGFYRGERGVRDPGYDLNDGGQFRVQADHDLGRGKIELDYKRIDDHTGFLPDEPFATTGSGGVKGVPGLSPLTGILAGPQTAQIPVLKTSGPGRIDITQGTAVTLDQFSAHVTQDVDGWKFDDHFRYRDTDQQRIGLFPASVQTGALRVQQLTPQGLAAFPGATSLQLRDRSTGALFTADENGNGLEVDDAARQVSLSEWEVLNDLRASRQFHLFGQTHDVSLGVYAMTAGETFDRYSAVALVDVKNHADLLDLVAVNAAGAVVGSLTDNGVLRDGSEFADGHGGQTTWAVYAADEWSVTHALRIDAGARYEHVSTSGASEGTKTVNLGLSPTPADDSYLTGDGVFTPYDRTFSAISWTVGADYQLDARQGVFARATSAARMPSVSDFITNSANMPVISHTEMYELGYKLSRKFIDLYATLFDTEYHNYGVGETIYDPTTQLFVSQAFYADTRDYGLELDGTLRPIRQFEIAFSGTVQDPTFTSLRYTTLSAGSLTTLDYNGNQLLRIPKTSFAVTPALYFWHDRLRADVTIEHFSDRYADAANTQLLPEYTVVSASARYRLTPDLTLYVSGYNLTNEIGLTEGNPRSGELLSTQAGAPVFIARSINGRSVRASILYKF